MKERHVQTPRQKGAWGEQGTGGSHDGLGREDESGHGRR